LIGEDGQPLDPAEAVMCPLCVLHSAPNAFVPDSATIIANAPRYRPTAIKRQSQHTHPGIFPGTPDSPRAPPAFI
jgi:hypothetical protein